MTIRGTNGTLPGSHRGASRCAKSILVGLPDPAEAEVLDKLLRDANEYFHRGRHVAKEGQRQGECPVTHADARLALSLATLLVSHVAHVLSRAG